jgi:Leucine-rich repeat (LRR) protein
LRNNQLTALPDSLSELQNLTHLDLRNNRFLSLPASIGDLPNLQKLDLRWNKLRTVPDWIHRFEQRGCIVFQ